jgi:hypothetical protein
MLEPATEGPTQPSVTTPNRWHPIDLHTALPLLHWLPPSIYRPIYGMLGFGLAILSMLHHAPWGRDEACPRGAERRCARHLLCR